MNLHLHKLDVLKLICAKYNILYDEIKDENNVTVEIVFKDKDVCITWESKGFEVVNNV